jgi:hypothetical protein
MGTVRLVCIQKHCMFIFKEKIVINQGIKWTNGIGNLSYNWLWDFFKPGKTGKKCFSHFEILT